MKVEIRQGLVIKIKKIIGDRYPNGNDEHFKNKLEGLANLLIRDEIKKHETHEAAQE